LKCTHDVVIPRERKRRKQISSSKGQSEEMAEISVSDTDKNDHINDDNDIEDSNLSDIEDSKFFYDDKTFANIEGSFLLQNDFVDEEITIEEHKPKKADHYSADIDDLLADDSNSNDEITHTEDSSGKFDTNDVENYKDKDMNHINHVDERSDITNNYTAENNDLFEFIVEKSDDESNAEDTEIIDLESDEETEPTFINENDDCEASKDVSDTVQNPDEDVEPTTAEVVENDDCEVVDLDLDYDSLEPADINEVEQDRVDIGEAKNDAEVIDLVSDCDSDDDSNYIMTNVSLKEALAFFTS